MGAKVHCESYSGACFSMRDLNEKSSSSSWHRYDGEKSTTNGQYPVVGLYPMASVDGYPVHEDSLKQKMLEHEAVFKNQVFELHRLYQIQRDMMEEVRRAAGSHRLAESNDPSSSSSHPGRPLYTDHSGKSFSMVEMVSSPIGCTKGKNVEPEMFRLHNGYSLDGRPLKVRRRLFDLQLPADEYIDVEADKQLECLDVIYPNGPGEIEEEATPSFDFLSQISFNERKKDISQPARLTGFHMHNGFLNLPGSSKSNPSPPKTHSRQHSVLDQVRPVDQPFMSPQSSGSQHPFFSSCFGDPWAPPSDSANGASLQTSAPYLGIHLMDHGPTSGSRELKDHMPSAGFGYLNYSSGDNLQSGSSKIHGSGNFTDIQSMPGITFDLNEVVPKGLPATVRSPNIIDGQSKPEDHLSTWPWLKRKPVNAKELCSKKEAAGDLNQSGMLANKISEVQNVEKIFGVPIFVRCDPGENPSSHVSTSSRKHESKEIDTNKEYEMDEVPIHVEKKALTKGATLKGSIDLNSCFTDDEDYCNPAHDNTAVMKIDSENETEKRQDEVLVNAAEILVTISSYPVHIHKEDSSFDPQGANGLIWFANAMTSSAHELEEVDDFEFTTLELQEMKEEDYMPMPPVVPKMDHIGTTSMQTRPRRGNSRRGGRQRRDFQQHILPGLATLSRHDVTEDLQTFGGIMRAAGHDWISSLNRSNSSARGRKRAVAVETVSSITLAQQVNKIEVVIEDRRLRGWGKKTGRPRRQRCPPTGNPAAAVFLS